MNKHSQRLAEAGKLLMAEYREGYADGIATGLQTAVTILTWFKANPQLKEPKSVEELITWSERELTNLRSKLPQEDK